MMHELSSLLVIVYGKKLSESQTITSLAKYNFKDVVLRIVNNGPEKFDSNDTNELISKLKKSFFSVDIIEHIENIPLSIAYNRFVECYPSSKKYIFLDDDSTITDDFAFFIGNDFYYDLELPLIKCADICYYPTENKVPINKYCELDGRQVMSIGSGMVVSCSLKKKFEQHNVKLFDEHYALYGVDTSFFKRMKKIIDSGTDIKIKCNSHIVHSLSRTEGVISDFRKKERQLDLALTMRHYPDWKIIKSFFSQCIKSLFKGNVSTIVIMFDAFFSGMHPRCKKYSANKQISVRRVMK